MMNKYRWIKTKNGRDREHRVVAQKIIGRALLPKEVVHHLNHDGEDNHAQNLVVCASQKEHYLFHLRAPRVNQVCVVCGQTFVLPLYGFLRKRNANGKAKYCSKVCFRKDCVKPIDWSLVRHLHQSGLSIRKIAQIFNIHHSNLIRRARNLKLTLL